MILINADDWGRSTADTDCILACFLDGGITSTSAMVFMADSRRAAALALENGLEVGLHVNFSEKYSGTVGSEQIAAHTRIVKFITASKYALLLYHPWLRTTFRSVYQAQLQEFLRLYGKAPSHVDGHQHMHLCANMVIDRIISRGERVRRNFSYFPGEKGFFNRSYRRCIDGILERRYRTTDYFFSLEERLRSPGLAPIAEIARTASVEIMTHPRMPAEYDYLRSSAHLKFLKEADRGPRLPGPARTQIS